MSTFSFKTLPQGLMILLGLILCIEVLLPIAADRMAVGLLPYTSPMTHDQYRVKAMQEIAEPYQNKIYFVGSSQVREGIDPRTWEALLAPTKVFNFGLSGAFAREHWLNLPEFLADPPQLLVTGGTWVYFFYEEQIYRHKRFFDRFADLGPLVELYGPKDAVWKLKGYARDLGLNLLLPSSYVMHHLRLRPILAEYLFGPERSEPDRFGYDEDKELLRWKAEKTYKNMLAEPHPLTLKAMELYFEKSRGLPQIYVEMPVNPILYQWWPDARPKQKSFQAQLQKWSEEYGFVFVPCDGGCPQNSEDFIDFTHLNESGRAKFMEHLRPQVEQLLIE